MFFEYCKRKSFLSDKKKWINPRNDGKIKRDKNGCTTVELNFKF